MKKKILVIPSDLYGVGSFRFIEPHVELQKQFPDEFDIDINPNVNFDDIAYLTQFDIIFGNRDMCSLDKAENIFAQLREKGIKIVVDIDDHWELSPAHPHYQYSKYTKTPQRITTMLTLVDYVTTTTEYFAKDIRKYNKNVVVFPNGVDPTAKKFQISEQPSDKVRIGWLGGSSHMGDLKMLKSFMSSINDRYEGKIQTVLCGFDTRGTFREIDKNTGREIERPIKPMETCWYEYEKIFTSDYKYVSPEYKEHLMKFVKTEFPGIENEQYRRVWTKPMSTYSLNYNLFDITLAPLEQTKFNMSKSQLKVIESGFFKKPVIASDIAPYQIDIKHGENGFLVKNNSGTKNWSYYANKLINDPVFAKEMGGKLYETVKDKYDIRNIAKDRAEWYKTL